MTLKAQILSDITSVFLNTDEFAEGWTYYPKGGTSRSITATVAEESADFESKANSKNRVRKLQLLVPNSSSTGIPNPTPGDYVTRDSDTDNPPARWMFQQIVHQDASSLTLEFTHSRPTRTGHHSGLNQ